MLTLYFSRGSCALASMIALEESGLDHQARPLDFSRTEQQSPEYLAINPKGRVPALVTDYGVITETPAILAYVAQLAPEARLAPLDDPFEFAHMQAINSYLCSTVHVNHAHSRRGYRWADDAAAHEAMRAKVTQNMTDCFRLIEASMFRGPWVMGENFSVADPYLFTVSGWLKGDGVDIDQFVHISDHRARMLERPAVQRALATEKMTLSAA